MVLPSRPSPSNTLILVPSLSLSLPSFQSPWFEMTVISWPSTLLPIHSGFSSCRFHFLHQSSLFILSTNWGSFTSFLDDCDHILVSPFVFRTFHLFLDIFVSILLMAQIVSAPYLEAFACHLLTFEWHLRLSSFTITCLSGFISSCSVQLWGHLTPRSDSTALSALGTFRGSWKCFNCSVF